MAKGRGVRAAGSTVRPCPGCPDQGGSDLVFAGREHGHFFAEDQWATSWVTTSSTSTFIDIHGQPANTPPASRVIGLTLEDLRRIPNVIAIASEPTKVTGIPGALRTGAIDTPATARSMAQTLLSLAQATETPRAQLLEVLAVQRWHHVTHYYRRIAIMERAMRRLSASDTCIHQYEFQVLRPGGLEKRVLMAAEPIRCIETGRPARQ